MRLLKDNIARDGSVVLLPEEPEDMWQLYNLISRGDRIRAPTFRKVKTVQATTGSVSSNKVMLNLTLEIEGIPDFDPTESTMRVHGKNVQENEHVKLGAYHTTELQPHRKFTLQKVEWDSIALERLKDATSIEAKADVAAVVMHAGLALVCLVTSNMTIVRAKIEQSIPRKRAGGAALAHQKAMESFFEAVLQAVIRIVDWTIVKCLIVASPGYVKDDFFKFVMEQAQKRDMRTLLANKERFMLVHSSSGHKHALKEVLAQEEVRSRLADTKAVSEVRALESFFEMLNTDEHRAYYGYNHVRAALDMGAVATLLLVDGLFRADHIATRRKYVKLVEDARAAGVQVYIFSSMHVSGEQLAQLSGVAAALRFPLPELEDLDEDMDEEEQRELEHEQAEQAADAAAAAATAGHERDAVFLDDLESNDS